MIINRLKSQIKNLIFDLNDIFPLVGRPLIYMWRIVHNLKFIIGKRTLETKYKLKHSLERKNFTKTYWINPDKIKYKIANRFNKWNQNFEILEGAWNRGKKSFEESLIYQAFKERFIDSKNWGDISYYHQILNQLQNNSEKWGCKNKNELDDKLKKMEFVFDQIKKNSSILNKTIYIQEDKENLENLLDWEDIIVVISKEGYFLLVSGDFSLSVAKLFQVPEIPIKVVARHKKWTNFKLGLIYYARHGRLYQKLTHPDLKEIPYHYGEERFDIIKENLSISKGTLLDIGTNLGYFCRKFEEEGFDCYGVEANWYQFNFLKKLKIAEEKKFKIIHDSIFNYNKNRELVFDVILALNIFHHFIRRKNTYANLIKLLNRIKVKELFFGVHNPNEFKNKKVYRNYSPEQFVAFLLKNSCLNNAQFLAKFDNGRTLYKLSS